MTWRPGRGFRLGKMRESLDIWSATYDNSTGQPEPTWSPTYERQPASWTPTNGGETVNGRQVEAGINAVFTVRRVEGLSPEQRVLHHQENRGYGIVYVHPVEGGRRYVDLHCKSIDGWFEAEAEIPASA